MFLSHWYMFNSFYSWTIQLIFPVRTRRPDRDAKRNSAHVKESTTETTKWIVTKKGKENYNFCRKNAASAVIGYFFLFNFKRQAMANAWINEENDSKQTRKRRIDHDNDYWYQIVRVVTISNCLIGVNFVYSFLLCANVQTSPLNHKY